MTALPFAADVMPPVPAAAAAVHTELLTASVIAAGDPDVTAASESSSGPAKRFEHSTLPRLSVAVAAAVLLGSQTVAAVGRVLQGSGRAKASGKAAADSWCC